MSGYRVIPNLPDSELCTDTYPAAGGPHFGSLCNEVAGHDDNHWALAVVAGEHRRYVVWTQAGVVLPDEETSRAAPAAGQTSPSKGDQVT